MTDIDQGDFTGALEGYRGDREDDCKRIVSVLEACGIHECTLMDALQFWEWNSSARWDAGWMGISDGQKGDDEIIEACQCFIQRFKNPSNIMNDPLKSCGAETTGSHWPNLPYAKVTIEMPGEVPLTIEWQGCPMELLHEVTEGEEIIKLTRKTK